MTPLLEGNGSNLPGTAVVAFLVRVSLGRLDFVKHPAYVVGPLFIYNPKFT
jgi:hypothetical protein